MNISFISIRSISISLLPLSIVCEINSYCLKNLIWMYFFSETNIVNRTKPYSALLIEEEKEEVTSEQYHDCATLGGHSMWVTS